MKAFVLIVCCLFVGTAAAAENAPPAKVTPVMTRDLEGIAGKEMLVLVV
jgi:hypothetical protein